MSSPLHYEDLEVGLRWASGSRTITEADVVAFAGVCGDFNPIHVDARHTPAPPRSVTHRPRRPRVGRRHRAAPAAGHVPRDAEGVARELGLALPGAGQLAAKSALVGAARALAVQWAPRLRVNAVAPGLVDTPTTEAMPSDVYAKLVARVPAERAADPGEVADAVAYLASDRASYITGQMLLAGGGRSAG